MLVIDQEMNSNDLERRTFCKNTSESNVLYIFYLDTLVEVAGGAPRNS